MAFYAYYNIDSGQLTKLSNELENDNKDPYVIARNHEVRDIVLGLASLGSLSVEYDEQTKERRIVKTVLKKDIITHNQSGLYFVPYNQKDCDITITILKGHVEFELSNKLKSDQDTVNLLTGSQGKFFCSITQKNNPFVLLEHVICNTSEMKDGKYKVKLKSNLPDDISFYVQKKFSSYSWRYADAV